MSGRQTPNYKLDPRRTGRDHDDTPTTKAALKVERQLKAVLFNIYNHVKNDVSVSSGVGVSFTAVRSFYELPARDVIRAAVTEIYIEGARYVTVRAHKITFFLTEDDVLVMDMLAKEFVQYFWQGLENEFVKKLASAFDPKTLAMIPASQLKGTFVDRLVESLGSRVMAEATIAKTQQISDRQIELQPVSTRSAQLIPEGYDPLEFLNLYQPKSFALQGFLEGELPRPKMVWLTARDERVCPVCLPLHGQVWDVSDPSIMIPALHSHIRCRCRLMLVDKSGNVIMR